MKLRVKDMRQPSHDCETVGKRLELSALWLRNWGLEVKQATHDSKTEG